MDIVERLRGLNAEYPPFGAAHEAADEITRLRAELLTANNQTQYEGGEREVAADSCPHCHSTGFRCQAFMHKETGEIRAVVVGNDAAWESVNVYSTDYAIPPAQDRNAIIEECAKVCDFQAMSVCNEYEPIAKSCAAAIRVMKASNARSEPTPEAVGSNDELGGRNKES